MTKAKKGTTLWRRLKKDPYWRHLFSRHKLRGRWVTWSLGARWWLRIGRVIVRAEYIPTNAGGKP